MDLIYMNSSKEDIGVMQDYTFDLAFGSDENDFECTIVGANHCCDENFFLYIEGTEYGGIIDEINVDTEKDEITYSGRTWHGILDSKVFEPDAGEDYLILSGEANGVLGVLIGRIGLSDLFCASSDDSGITVSDYEMNRYIEGYVGIKKMLKAYGAKLNMSFKNGFVELSAKPVVNYSQDEQFDKDQIAFVVKKKSNVLNHVICLGKGELSAREVIHVYADENGNISETQVYTGLKEVTGIYENVNAADSEELKKGGIDMLTSAWASDELDFTFDSDEESYDIGDVVGAKEYMTGTEVSHEITKKIVKIESGMITISYPKDTTSGSASISSGGFSESSSGSTDATTLNGKAESQLSVATAKNADALENKSLSDIMLLLHPIGSIYMSVDSSNPAALFGGTWVAWGAGRVPVGVNASDTDFSTAEKTGGTKTHTLTTSEMPSHGHSVSVNNCAAFNTANSAVLTSGGSGTLTTNNSSVLTTSENGAHQHGIKYAKGAASGTAKNHINSDGGGSSTAVCGSAGDHTHTVPAHAHTIPTHTHTVPAHAHSVPAHGHTVNQSNAGGGAAHNNMQPFVTCYMWKRTA